MLYRIILFIQVFVFSLCLNCFASVKAPEFGDQFYPAQKDKLTAMLDEFLDKAPVSYLPYYYHLITTYKNG